MLTSQPAVPCPRLTPKTKKESVFAASSFSSYLVSSYESVTHARGCERGRRSRSANRTVFACAQADGKYVIGAVLTKDDLTARLRHPRGQRANHRSQPSIGIEEKSSLLLNLEEELPRGDLERSLGARAST